MGIIELLQKTGKLKEGWFAYVLVNTSMLLYMWNNVNTIYPQILLASDNSQGN